MGLRFGRGLRELHTAGLAPASGVHLRFHDHLAAQSVGAGARLRRRRRHLARRDGNAVAPQNVARLILVQVQVCSFVIVVPASP